MINFNGTILENQTVLSMENRGYAYGDALFETVKSVRGNLLFWEDHYFRLMASMRIMRMEIPMNFTMEYLENQVLKTLETNALSDQTARVKLTVHRAEGGLYLPENHDVGFVISVKPLATDAYRMDTDPYVIDLFKDYYLSPSLLSTLKTNNKALNVIGSIYARENGLANCLLLNTNKNVVEALNGNLFLVKDQIIKTPPLTEGCLNGIMRKQLLRLLKNHPAYEVREATISAFELQKADEIFITNVIAGIQPVTKYRKKQFSMEVSKDITRHLNESLGLT
ncbi:aminotransferase class IV [Aestuariivivens sediminicola]|uniref:aminotransferase class IV n=1 Tax=Aestuariivivens sediminicola TaxID=2913560 RepID=UPI001F562645|nr:aminotransferase class IV [Aestuariivivens sediminicola]